MIGHLEIAVLGDDYAGFVVVPCVGDPDPFDPRSLVIDMIDQDEIAGNIGDEDARAEDQGRAHGRNISPEFALPFVKVRENLVVEFDHPESKHGARDKKRRYNPKHIDARSFQGGDFEIGGESSERHQAGDQNGHRDGQGQHPGQVQPQKFQRHPDREIFVDHVIGDLGDKIDNQQECYGEECKEERGNMFFEYVSAEYLHKSPAIYELYTVPPSSIQAHRPAFGSPRQPGPALAG